MAPSSAGGSQGPRLASDEPMCQIRVSQERREETVLRERCVGKKGLRGRCVFRFVFVSPRRPLVCRDCSSLLHFLSTPRARAKRSSGAPVNPAALCPERTRLDSVVRLLFPSLPQERPMLGLKQITDKSWRSVTCLVAKQAIVHARRGTGSGKK